MGLVSFPATEAPVDNAAVVLGSSLLPSVVVVKDSVEILPISLVVDKLSLVAMLVPTLLVGVVRSCVEGTGFV